MFFNDRFEEYLRISNFDDFVNGLVYYGYESCEYYFGIHSEESLGSIARKLTERLSLKLEEKKDNRHGWFNFSSYYSGDLRVEENFRFHFTVSPNQFANDTYLFQEHPTLNLVVGIIPIRGKFETIAVNSSKYKSEMIKMIDSIDGIKRIDLLIPENVNE